MTAQPREVTAEFDLRDLEALRTPVSAQIAGLLLGAAGFFVTASAVQLTFDAVTWLQVLGTAPLWLCGVTSLLGGPLLYTGRASAAVLGAPAAIAAAITCALWAIYAVVASHFALMVILGAGASGLAALAVPFAVVPTWRVSRARRALFQ
ncbi:MAG: hypothetical protein R3F59_06615 [Myxococcota bacterium]